jgi:hypothetical protein
MREPDYPQNRAEKGKQGRAGADNDVPARRVTPRAGNRARNVSISIAKSMIRSGKVEMLPGADKHKLPCHDNVVHKTPVSHQSLQLSKRLYQQSVSRRILITTVGYCAVNLILQQFGIQALPACPCNLFIGKRSVIGLSMQPHIQVSCTGLLTLMVGPSPAWDRTKQSYVMQRSASYSNVDENS